MPTPLEFARSQQTRFLEELKSLLRIPSISTLPQRARGVSFGRNKWPREPDGWASNDESAPFPLQAQG
jgi:hypothetical protein